MMKDELNESTTVNISFQNAAIEGISDHIDQTNFTLL